MIDAIVDGSGGCFEWRKKASIGLRIDQEWSNLKSRGSGAVELMANWPQLRQSDMVVATTIGFDR